jgi:hypothetical protein
MPLTLAALLAIVGVIRQFFAMVRRSSHALAFWRAADYLIGAIA